jgi:hypothetical protein
VVVVGRVAERCEMAGKGDKRIVEEKKTNVIVCTYTNQTEDANGEG